MPPELYRRARRAEAGAERAEDRRRRRLDFFRGALAEGFEALKRRHAEGASGEDSVRTYARFMDDLVGSLAHLASADAEAAGLAPTPFVLVALGGYGRGELHPSSDIDLMIVYDGELSPYVQRVMQELLYTLWDLGLQVGHSLRSLEDCVAMARTDFPSRTSMQEARLVVGDKKLFARFGRVLRDNVYRRDFEQFLATTLAEREQRYRKHGASPYIGEPNIKESAGGLRDMHTAMWLGAAKFGARTLRELTDRGLITPHEQEAADRALTFLWRVRNELHFFSGHKNDMLSRELQPRIAKNLGYENEGDALGVERFMREYYLNARAIHRVSQRLIGRYLPEFGGLTCLVQYDVYHKFSADQHSLLAVEHLEALAPGQSAESEGAAAVFNEVDKPELLMLGMLLHDIGKAKGHGHVAKGIPLVRELVERMGLEPADGAVVEFLVAHHLTMSHIAQRRDIDDPKTIADLATVAGDAQRLKMLYLLTWADMRAVGPGVLTPWQARVLHELYTRTNAQLAAGRVDRPSRPQIAERLRLAVGEEQPVQVVKAHLAMMSDRYIATTGVQRMAEDVRMLQRLGEGSVVTELFHHRDLGSSDLVVVTRDLPGLFSLIAGTLASQGVNIMSTQISV